MTSPPAEWVLVSAGEVSGDRMAAPVVRELRRRHPGWRFFGAGGPCLERVGVEIRHRIERLSVTGLVEAVGRAPAALALLADLALEGRRRRPALALLVDYPGINTRLAALLRRQGVPVLYYGAPQRWAWLESRASVLRHAVNRLAVTLPFEEQWFRRRGVRACYVGHPVLDLFAPPTRSEARRRLGLSGSRPVLALLPGSRPNEIRRHLPLFLRALPRLPGLRAVLAAPPGGRRLCAELCGASAVHTDAAHALAAADVALCASGTATLELAVAGVPGVVVYRLSPLSAAVARRLVKVPAVALPNLLLGRQVLPELLQDEMDPRGLAQHVQRLLDPRVAGQIRSELKQVVASLGEPGVAGRVADLAGDLARGPTPLR